jgi:hypothetical protein
MKGKQKRGQAATEFLTSYGWAILVIMLVLAALVWLGIFNTSQAVPERCTFPAGFACSDVRITDTAISQITLENQMTKTVYVCAIMCTNDLQLGQGSMVVPPECASQGQSTVAILQTGQKQTITFNPVSQATACLNYFGGKLMSPNSPYKTGDAYTGSIVVFYSTAVDAGSGVQARMIAGDVYVKVVG